MKLSALRLLLWVQYKDGTSLRDTFLEVLPPSDILLGELPQYITEQVREFASAVYSSRSISWEIVRINDGPRNLLRTEISAPSVPPLGHLSPAE